MSSRSALAKSERREPGSRGERGVVGEDTVGVDMARRWDTVNKHWITVYVAVVNEAPHLGYPGEHRGAFNQSLHDNPTIHREFLVLLSVPDPPESG